MNGKTYLYILVCAAVSFLIRELPLTLIRRPIKSRFLRSFLFYVPYVTLAVMTFPSIVNATSSPIAGLAALVLGIAAADRAVQIDPILIFRSHPPCRADGGIAVFHPLIHPSFCSCWIRLCSC